jgi:threonine dehydrogenase-like Zn-dependent dehydrogenase
VVAVEPRPAARAWALEAGADEALHPDDAVARIRTRGGVDVALEFVGRKDSVEAAVRSLDRGGRAVVVGIGHGSASAGRFISFVSQERELVGSWGSEPAEIRHVLGLLASGELRLPRMVGEVIGLDEVPAALERLARGQIGGSRIVVDLAG